MALNITTYRMPDGILPKLERTSVALLQEHLEAVGADGDFLATAREQITFRSNIKFKFVRYENGQLICKLKPGDNSTAWTWYVTPPTGVDGDRLGRRLNGEPDDDELLQAAIPSDFNPGSLSQAIQDRMAQRPATPAPAPAVVEELPDKDDDEDEAADEPVVPVPKVSPKGATILERYEAARKLAEPYEARLAKIERLRRDIDDLMKEIEDKEGLIKQLEIESNKDAAGKAAYEKHQQIERLLDL